jgi:urease accessory protein
VAVPEAFEKQWLTLNERLSAYKPARESREAGGTLGRRLLQLVRQLEDLPLVESAIESARQAGVECHHCAAFGLVGGLLGTGEEFTAVTFLQQSLTGLVSACQRLLPLGQTRAARLIWDLKAPLLEVIAESQKYVEKAEPEFFSALPELGSMRHPTLSTRLFIS